MGFKCPVQHLGGDHNGGISVTLIFVRSLRKQLVSSHQTTWDTCGIQCSSRRFQELWAWVCWLVTSAWDGGMDGPRSHRDGADSTSFLVSLTAEIKHPDKSCFRGKGLFWLMVWRCIPSWWRRHCSRSLKQQMPLPPPPNGDQWVSACWHSAPQLLSPVSRVWNFLPTTKLGLSTSA